MQMFVVVNGQMLKKLPSSQLGTLVVVASVLAFHSDGQSPNPAEAFSLFSVKCCKCCLAQSLCSVSCLIHGFFDPILDEKIVPLPGYYYQCDQMARLFSWLFFNIRPLTSAMAYKICQSRSKKLRIVIKPSKNCPSLWRFYQSGKISPNLVTLKSTTSSLIEISTLNIFDKRLSTIVADIPFPVPITLMQCDQKKIAKCL